MQFGAASAPRAALWEQAHCPDSLDRRWSLYGSAVLEQGKAPHAASFPEQTEAVAKQSLLNRPAQECANATASRATSRLPPGRIVCDPLKLVESAFTLRASGTYSMTSNSSLRVRAKDDGPALLMIQSLLNLGIAHAVRVYGGCATTSLSRLYRSISNLLSA